MAISKSLRKTIVFSAIALVLISLTILAIVRKREVAIAVQTEKVGRRNITEIVVANGKIQPVLQVKISPEVSGEIIELPVKEGDAIKRGDLIVKIKPEFYVAQLHQAEAGYAGALAGKTMAEATLRKAESEYKRGVDLSHHHLVSPSDFDSLTAAYDVAKAQLDSAIHQVEMSKANVESAQESLDKTTITSPLTGNITKLNSRLGERVLGTVQNVGTEIMTISDLNEMEARVDLGENDIVLITPGQKTRLEVDAFKNRKFNGTVTEIANSSNDSNALGQMGGSSSSSSSQEATKFQVRIRVQEKEAFRPGMSVTAEIETRTRTNVLAVPIASVTSRLPKEHSKTNEVKIASADPPSATNSNCPSTNSSANLTNSGLAFSNPISGATNLANSNKKPKEAPKPVDVVFVLEKDRVKAVPVKLGISDDNFWEITDGLTEGQEIVSGDYKAINKELEDGKKTRKGASVKENLK
jgi:HlyD family secretion protein